MAKIMYADGRQSSLCNQLFKPMIYYAMEL